MARRLYIQTFLQQAQGLAAMAERSPQPLRATRLFLRALPSPSPERRGITISIAPQNQQDGPAPVNITHMKATAPAPRAPA